MALGNKYSFTFLTVKDGEQFVILIKQEGFAGTVEQLDFMPGRNFVILGYDRNNANLLWPIRGSQLTVIISLQPAQIAEFVLADNKTWFIEVTGANGFEWYGWLQPQTSANYTPFGLRELTLQFSDNLGSLQNSPDNVFQDAFIALQPIKTMIERQVSYTNITLPFVYNTSVRLHGQAVPIHEYTYLEQIMCLDLNGVEPQMAYTLLSKELRLMQSTIYQKGGNWVIDNFIDKSLALYPASLLSNFEILSRGLNVRFESPLSKATGKSFHYNTRHAIKNRDFTQYVSVGPNQGFIDWEQFGTLATAIYSQVIIAGISYFGVLGNYVGSVANSTDTYEQTGITVAASSQMKLFLNYNNTFSGVGLVNARISLKFQSGANVYYLNTENEWILTGTPIVLIGETEINYITSRTSLAPAEGEVTIVIYRPEVPVLGTTYNSGTSYIRYSYADFGIGKDVLDTDYKVFKSLGRKDNQGVRPNEVFETIGLAFDNEIYPNPSSLFEDYVSLFYDDVGDKVPGDFISDYMPTSKEWGPTEFATNTYMRLFAKPQLYIEVDLYGKNLNVGDIYEVDIPGFATPYKCVVVAFDWDIKNDKFSALLAYISYDEVDTIVKDSVWILQRQEDIDK